MIQKKWSSFLVASIFASLLTGASTLQQAHAAEQPVGLSSGGGYDDPRYPASPVSVQVMKLKQQLIDAENAGKPVPQDAVQQLEQIWGLSATDIAPFQDATETTPTLATLITAVRHKINPNVAPVPHLYGGWTWIGYTAVAEPTSSPNPSDPPAWDSGYYANLCGPGASTVAIGGWLPFKVNWYTDAYGSGPQEYLLHIAHTEMVDQGYKNAAGTEVYLTPYNNVVNTVNNEIGLNFYMNSGVPSYTSWVSHLDKDVNLGTPTIIGVNTSILEGWGYGTTHIVAINGNNDVSNEFQYFDTAPSSASGSTATYGNHILSRSRVAPYISADIW